MTHLDASNSGIGFQSLVRLWEAACNNATVSIFIVDGHQRCIYMNPAAENLTGYRLNELSGRGLHDVVHQSRSDGSHFPIEECSIDHAFPADAQNTGERVIVRKDGSFCPVAYTASPIKEDTTGALGTIIEMRDISAERRVEDALRADARMLEALNQFGTQVSAELDLQRLVEIVTDAGVKLAGAEFGAFFYNVADNDGERYTLYTISGVPREAFSKFPMPRNTEVFAPTFRGTGTVRSGDITKDPRYGKNSPHHGMPEGHLPVRSYLAVPVVSVGGEVLGGLFFGHSQPARFSERAEKLLTGIAAQVAIAIDNAKLFQAAQHEIRQREAAQEHLKVLLDELNHRVKNTLMTVQAIASQTLQGAASLPEARNKITSRLLALSKAHNLLSQGNWQGVMFDQVLREAICVLTGEDTLKRRVKLSGPPVRLPARLAQTFSMAFHELATNSIKYGALSTENSTVMIEWQTRQGGNGGIFEFRWNEYGGPPAASPRTDGFGTRLMTEILAREIDGVVTLDYAAPGFSCFIEAPEFDMTSATSEKPLAAHSHS